MLLHSKTTGTVPFSLLRLEKSKEGKQKTKKQAKTALI
jgi:hypothetical protein